MEFGFMEPYYSMGVRRGTYRNLSVSLGNAEWIVDSIFIGTDTHEYADLRSASDHSSHKTLALSVVADPARFVLVAPSAIVPLAHGGG